MRDCKKCGEPKDDSELRKDGRCKPCYNAYQLAWYRANRERITEKWRAQRAADPEMARAKERAYWAAHPEEKRAKDARYIAKDPEHNRQRVRDWAAADPDRARESARRSYGAHRESRIARVRQYATQNQETIAARKRTYYQQNRERLLEQARLRRQRDPVAANSGSRRRRAQKRAIGTLLGFHTEAEWRAKLAEFGGHCAYCGTTERITRDHIIPLSKGGADTIDNIQPLCYPCNSRKRASLA